MRIFHLLAAALVVSASPAFAGITIHFKGSVPDDTSIAKISEVACAEARKNSWQCQLVSGDEIARLDGITARSIVTMEGAADLKKVKGVVVHMHEMSEPLYLVFGPSRRIDNFVKTQFAGADVHVRTVELLRKVAPYFTTLEVEDEGDYWKTSDRSKLDREIEGVRVMMVKIKSQRSDVQGPVKRPDGRILDLVGK